MKKIIFPAFLIACFSYTPLQKKTVVVWQPSHQTDTGVDFSEAEVSNAIAEAAMEAKTLFHRT
jgi:hypothetical protein